MPKNHTFLVTLSMPDGVSLEDAEVYIDVAVREWRGSLGTHNPMFHLDPESVDVVAAGSTRCTSEARHSGSAAPGGQEPEQLQGGVAPAVPAAGVP
jgi:hypothetical protein